MSKIYKIEIEEIFQKIVEVKANSLKEAIEIAQDKYNDEYSMENEDFKGVEFREYTTNKNKENRER